MWLEELPLDFVKTDNEQPVQAPYSSFDSDLSSLSVTSSSSSHRRVQEAYTAHLGRELERELAHESLAEKLQVAPSV